MHAQDNVWDRHCGQIRRGPTGSEQVMSSLHFGDAASKTGEHGAIEQEAYMMDAVRISMCYGRLQSCMRPGSPASPT